MSDNRMRTYCFSLSPSMVRAIKDRASAERISMSYVVRLAVRAYFAAQGTPHPAPPALHERDDQQPRRP
ncbi:MAG: hypothetical protein NVS4B2_26750 [Chloroflexota bacterium]